MRATTLLRRILGIPGMAVDSVALGSGGELLVAVRPMWRAPRCGCCGRCGQVYDRRPERTWRHLAFGPIRVLLRYAPRRVDCRRCGPRTEQVPWGSSTSRFTTMLEELVAYLAQITDKTNVTKLAGIAWRTVGTIVERVVERELDWSRLDGLRHIGVDEFSYRKRHRYLTVVVDHDRKRVIWAAKGRSADVLAALFEELGPARCAGIELVTMDMSGGYIKAVREALPDATIVFDRFHVAQLASKALDEVRRDLVRKLTGTSAASAVKKLRFLLLRDPANNSDADLQRLAELQKVNRPLYRAYFLKEALAEILELEDPTVAEEALRQWLAWAARSRLTAFVRFGRTIRRHFQGILAFVSTRFTNARVEGINNALRMIARRAYGFHSAEALMAMLFLTRGGITLHPPLPT